MNLRVQCMLFFYIAIFWPIHIIAEIPRRALIFSKKTYQLDEINTADSNKKCYSCLTACPAFSTNRKKFNKKISIGKNSIYLQKVYAAEEPASNIDLEICHSSYRPSILFHKRSKSYQIGYELYYEEEKCTLKPIHDLCQYNEFKPTVITNSTRQQGQSNTFPQIEPENENDKNTKFKYSEGQILSFFWIPVLSLSFNPLKYQIRINFRGDINNNHATILKCKNHELGYELYRSNRNVNFFYSRQNRKELFSKINFALEQSPASSCPQPHKCLGRTYVMPMIYFNTKAAKMGTCTYINTVPMWSSIIDGQLKFVDRYLYTMFRLWYQNLQIVFGVADVITLNNAQNSAITTETHSGNPNNEDEIKIPKIIYRIVEYHLPIDLNNKKKENDQDLKDEEIKDNDEEMIDNDDEMIDNDEEMIKNDDDDDSDNDRDDDHDTIWTFYMAIIIHNDPEATDEDRLCPRQKNSLFDDWKSIYNDDAKKGLSYPCTLNDQIIQKLGAYDETPEDYDRVLYLSNVPYFDKKKPTKKQYNVDERTRIDKEMKNLFPENVS